MLFSCSTVVFPGMIFSYPTLAPLKSSQGELIVALLDGSRLAQPANREQEKTMAKNVEHVFIAFSFAYRNFQRLRSFILNDSCVPPGRQRGFNGRIIIGK